MRLKKIGTTVTSTMMAAGMMLGPAATAHAEEIPAALTAETPDTVETTDVAPVEVPVQTPGADTPAETPATPEPDVPTDPQPDQPADSTETPATPQPDQPADSTETPADPQPDVPSENPETPSEDPQPDASEDLPSSETPNETPEQSEGAQESEEKTEDSSKAETTDNWVNHIDYGKYFKHGAKDLRKGFAKIDKAYAYAKVDTSLNVREGTSKDSRIVGKLSKKAVCYVIADADKDWVYIESGDVRGFVKASYLQQGKKALKYVTKKGEDNVKMAEQIVDPTSNQAFAYSTNTVYDVTNGTGDGIIKFAEQFVGNPYVWGGNSLTDGIDCSHFVYQILSRCGAYSGEYTTSYGWRSLGEEVKSLDDAKAGDVVCYEGHVALYDGDGGIVEAKGSKWGITHDRKVDCEEILTIRRFVSDTDETGDSNAEVIENYLKSRGFSNAGIAGIMANIANEAYPAFEASSLEIKSIQKSGISSEQFTKMVDSGEISRAEVIASSRFGLYSGGRYGYGLCGFTDPVIKEYLCRYTIDEGKSIGSISGQLDSLIAYLEDYKPDLLSRLKNATDAATAASEFLREYENCANIEQENAERTAAAVNIFDSIK